MNASKHGKLPTQRGVKTTPRGLVHDTKALALIVFTVSPEYSGRGLDAALFAILSHGWHQQTLVTHTEGRVFGVPKHSAASQTWLFPPLLRVGRERGHALVAGLGRGGKEIRVLW